MAAPDSPAGITFVGNATTVLRLGPFTLLTDPNFLHRGQRAHLGYGMWTRRLTEPARQLHELPPLDGVLLSHLHGDHFDRIARRGLPADLPVTTTPAAARRLRRWGFAEATGLTTWQSRAWARGDAVLTVTAVPGQHAPGLLRHALPPVMGSILELTAAARRLRLYITGDTLLGPWLAEIPARFPDIDVLLVHLGGTRRLGLLLTMDDRQGTGLVELVRPGLTVPIHHSDYRAFRSPLRDFLDRLRRTLPGAAVRVLAPGQAADLPTRAAVPIPTRTS